MNHPMQIGKRNISAASHTFIVAEVSANHNQNYDRAVEIIHAAAEAGADAVKLQTYTADTLTIDCHDDCFMNKGGLWDGISEYDLYKQAYTPVSYTHLVTLFNRLQTVCNDHHGLPSMQAVNGIHNGCFRIIIKGRGCLIHNQHLRILKKCPGNADPLSLAS